MERLGMSLLVEKWDPLLFGSVNALAFLGAAQVIDFGDVDDEAVAACGAIAGMLNLPYLVLADNIHCIERDGARRCCAAITAHLGVSLSSSAVMKGAMTMAGWDVSYPTTLAFSGMGIVSSAVCGVVINGTKMLIDKCVNRE